MKIYFNLALLLILSSFCYGQNLNTEKTFQKTLAFAKKDGRPVLLIVKIKFPDDADNKKYENLAIQEKEVVEKMKANFAVYETYREDTAISKIISTYKINRFPAFVFMHANKDVFHVDFGYSSTKHKYLNMFSQALLASNEKSIATLESEYLANKTDYATLKKLIEQKRKMGITDNAELIEQYVKGLESSAFNDYQTVLFILEAGPYADGTAYKLAYSNRKIIDSIYKKEPVQTKTNISNYIIGNTMLSAVKIKSLPRALAGANFTRNSWGKNYERASKGYSAQLLYYYSAIRDTANYLKNAVIHYDRYYMNISADSIKKVEEKQRQAVMESNKSIFAGKQPLLSKEKLDSLRKANPQMPTRTETTILTSSANGYATDLNNIASRFYSTGTKNLNYLSKAMLWCKRAIELDPKWGYYDTLAHIYYAMGIHNEALATQKIAIDLAKKEANNTEYVFRTKEAYDKMKSKTL